MDPQTSLSSFIGLANASDRRRTAVARQVADQAGSDYAPEKDFWLRMRNAAKRDRASSRDGSAVFEVAHTATERKQNAFSEAAAGWAAILPRWEETTFEKAQAGHAIFSGIDVRIAPLFIERDSQGFGERVIAYFNVPPLSPPAVNAVLRIAELAYPADPTMITALIDVRRRTIHTRMSDSTASVDLHLASLARDLRAAWAETAA